MRAEAIRIECDEDGFHLRIQVIDGEADPELDFLVLDPDELYHAVQSVIGPWRYEARVAAREERAVAIREDGSLRMEPDEDAYDPTDPKHLHYHSVHVDHYDNRDKTKEDAA